MQDLKMNEIDLINNLKRIDIKPSRAWQRKTLKVLSLNASVTGVKEERNSFIALFNFLPKQIMGATIAVIAAVLLAVGGTAYASDSARPGDQLYPIDTFMEQVQRSLTLDPQALANFEVDRMDERVNELASIQEEIKNVGETQANLEKANNALGELVGQIERVQEKLGSLTQLRLENKLTAEEQQQLMQRLGEAIQTQLGVMDQVKTQLQQGEGSAQTGQDIEEVQADYVETMQTVVETFEEETELPLDLDFKYQNTQTGDDHNTIEQQTQTQNEKDTEPGNGN